MDRQRTKQQLFLIKLEQKQGLDWIEQYQSQHVLLQAMQQFGIFAIKIRYFYKDFLTIAHPLYFSM